MDELQQAIAIIGMAGRFPGAKNVDEFWQNLRDGVESISFFSDEELQASGIDYALLKNPHYVKAKGVLEEIELFDAGFFGINPREAAITDPQHRLFLESAWSALENAGYNPETYQGSIGVYAGVGMSGYLLNNLYSNPEVIHSVGAYQLLISNDKDFLPTRVSYKLNLKGPSVNIQTACSTSLVATCLACQSLLNYQCDIALAGGVSISVPSKIGYLHQEGMILSPDGHCRAFDAKAQGTVNGNGVGIVVLKRLEDAIADGDSIHAVIRGFAINNDGCLKVGYTAPSIDGQAEAIAQALAMAEVDPETINYIEAHGTGTPLGDPIEIAALTQAFRANTEKKGFCAIGSAKTNIGHLDTAAGVTGLIKTVQALKHKLLPPSLHFEKPNPRIDFANSPFFVNAKLSEWQRNGTPRRAGVSSFGIGGTNAHVVLEEAPILEPSGDSRPWQLLVLSAKTESAIDTATANLVEHLNNYPEINLADAAYTLGIGRKAFNHRRILVCQDREDAVTALSQLDAKRVFTNFGEVKNRPVAFMFSGQGSQYANMAAELYQLEPIFREEIDFCAEFLIPYLGLDLRDVLYASEEQAEQLDISRKESQRQAGCLSHKNFWRGLLQQTAIAQPALFAIEYALAKLWMSWGVHPQGAIGHSIGEYVAACLAGVFSLEEALSLVAVRGKLMQQMLPGSMLAVPLTAQQVQPLLDNELELAAINAPSLCVVSGATDAIEALQQKLLEKGVECRRLHTSHAFHSQMMEPILEVFTEQVKKVNLKAPQIPYISNVTGTWIAAEEATNPHYWARHLRQTVLFSSGLQTLWQESDWVLLEIGPGKTLTTLAKQHLDKVSDRIVVSSLRHPQDRQSDVTFLLNTVGKLWLSGIQIDWSGFYSQEKRDRVPLPTYPFERQRYWIEPPKIVGDKNNNSVPEWTSILEAAKIQALAEISKFDNPTYLRKKECLDRLCIAYMNLALRELGAFSNPNEKYSLEELCDRFPILPRHKQLISVWLKTLVEERQLQEDGEKFTNLVTISPDSINALEEELKAKWADTPEWAEVIQTYRQKLVPILVGKEDPLQLIFSESFYDVAESIGRALPLLPYHNNILRTSLQQLVKSLSPQVNLRILEIGAGMGLTTTELLPVLPPQQTNYIFTDVARFFLDKAKQKFSDYPHVQYRLLDIEQPPEKQGYEAHSFDVIIAAQVLHVTRNIEESLAHIRSLLAPDGLLLIWEVTQAQMDYNITDGLMMKPLSDGERTQGNPFLSKKQWIEALRNHGFVDIAVFPETDVLGHHILLAKASASADIAAPSAFTVYRENAVEKAEVAFGKKAKIAEWFYTPSWQRSLPPKPDKLINRQSWLLFVDECGFGEKLVKKLEQENQDVIVVKAGNEFISHSDIVYTINPQQRDDYEALLKEVRKVNKTPQKIVHLWSVTPNNELEIASLEASQNLGFYSLLFLAQALGKQDFSEEIEIAVISNNMQEVTGDEILCPQKATILGPCKVIPQEYLNISCRSIDVVLPEAGNRQREKIADYLFAEITAKSSDLVIAYRGNHRWVQTFESVQLDSEEKLNLREGGVYLITGGLGGIGLVLAEYLAEKVQAKLVLIARSHFPAKHEWQQWLASHEEKDSISCKIRKLQQIESLGAEVLVASADVANLEQMQQVIANACDRFGTINGVIHAAGISPGGMIQLKTKENLANLLAPKVKGTLVIDALLKDFNLDFLILCSSLNSFIAGLGLVDHCGANAFLDAFAHYNTTKCDRFTISVNWDGWQEVGQAANSATSEQLKKWREASFKQGIFPQEGIEAFKRILGTTLPQIMVSTQDFIIRFQQYKASKELQHLQSQKETKQSKLLNSRPQLNTAYVTPRDRIEQTIAEIWQQSLGIDKIGIYDDFFELGGDSLLAIHLIAKISEATNTKLSAHSLIDAPTIADLAKLIAQATSPTTSNSTLVEIQTGSNTKKPIFLVHPIGGHVYIYRELARYLPDLPVYGFQAQGVDGKAEPLTTVEEMAAQYIEALRVVQPEGPYFLGGSSFGGTVAFEMAQQLQKLGQKVAMLTLIDTPSPDRLPSENLEDDDLKTMAYALGVGADISISANKLAQMNDEERLLYFLEKGKSDLKMPADFGVAELRRFYQVFKLNMKAMKKYIPQVYSGQIIFFRACDRDAFNPENPELGWKDLAAGGLEIHVIPGNHITMNFAPNVDVMAQRLKTKISEVLSAD
ncbi:beta-ketoacyl synthase N-terminal-like domain-containing protein [Aerosakkonema sp. BLCC-F183]|uniref:beta-ketoacyl synthase N-terminal-like domain-containing protein n=1 Tax=Aerosakkonema sp. BLCC-F183 TaxID=3342834 RepID=UPI0035B77797